MHAIFKDTWILFNNVNLEEVRTARCEFESRISIREGVQHYVIKLVSDLRHVGGFPWVLRFPPPIKLTPTI